MVIGEVRRPTGATKCLGPFGGPATKCLGLLAFGGFVLMWVEVEDPVCATLNTAMPFLLFRLAPPCFTPRGFWFVINTSSSSPDTEIMSRINSFLSSSYNYRQ